MMLMCTWLHATNCHAPAHWVRQHPQRVFVVTMYNITFLHYMLFFLLSLLIRGGYYGLCRTWRKCGPKRQRRPRSSAPTRQQVRQRRHHNREQPHRQQRVATTHTERSVPLVLVVVNQIRAHDGDDDHHDHIDYESENEFAHWQDEL